MKLPFINEEFKQRVYSVMRRLGIDNIKIHFMTGRPSSRVFAPSREKLNCPDDCETCKLDIELNRCLTKNVVYEITCSTYRTMYIGETGRTIGSRIKEYLTMDKQTVYKHLKSHKNSMRKDLVTTWKILHTNFKNHGERKCIEALEIKSHYGKIMNGCIGRLICL